MQRAGHQDAFLAGKMHSGLQTKNVNKRSSRHSAGRTSVLFQLMGNRQSGPGFMHKKQPDRHPAGLQYTLIRNLKSVLKDNLMGKPHKEGNTEERKHPAQDDKDRQHAKECRKPYRKRQMSDQNRPDKAHAKAHGKSEGDGSPCGHKTAVLKTSGLCILFSQGHAPL